MKPIVYLRKTDIKKDGKAPVIVKCHLCGKKVYFSTGVNIEPNKWNDELKKVKGSSLEIKDLNLIIDNCVRRITDIAVRYRLMGRDQTPDLLKKEYENPSVFSTFLEFVETERKKKKDIVAPSTIRAHNTLIAKLKKFNRDAGFGDITHDYIQDFRRYLRTLGNCENTIKKTLKNLRVYINIALRKMDIPPFRGQKVKRHY